MITEPKLDNRFEQPYAGIRVQAAIQELPTVIPQMTDEVFAWLKEQGIAPAGAPFVRYHCINMAEKLDITMGVPVAAKIAGDGRVVGDVLPGGRYATVLYTGHYSGLMEANRVLVDWAKDSGIEWDAWDDPNGHAFKGRYESYITDPGEEPDSSKWETEVAIKMADNQPR
jgi:effector-binding domain-containing protein